LILVLLFLISGCSDTVQEDKYISGEGNLKVVVNKGLFEGIAKKITDKIDQYKEQLEQQNELLKKLGFGPRENKIA
jgi:hypothetical protein